MTAPLDEISHSPKYTALKEARENHAARARWAQSQFRRWTGLFVLATLIAAICGGLLLYGIDPAPAAPAEASDRSVWQTCLLVLQAFSLAGAAFCGHLLRARDFNRVWTESRLQAETGRLDLERTALEIGHEISPAMFQRAGAGFRDFVDGQLDYLKRAEVHHEKSAGQIAIWGAIFAAIMALGGALAGVENKTILILIALSGVCTPALVTALKSISDASAAALRAELHIRTRSELNTLRGEFESFDSAIQSNDLTTAIAFADRAFEILRADHAGFAESRTKRDV